MNIKPLLPGHVLVVPRTRHARLTDVPPVELGDLFRTVQRVQHMLARHYFSRSGSSHPSGHAAATIGDGAFNIAIQDGAEAGQTVPHLHVHVIPRARGESAQSPGEAAEALYADMARERGNVGGALWDAAGASGGRPVPGGSFPQVEDADREARTMQEMEAEAGMFREVLKSMDAEKREEDSAFGNHGH